MFGDKGVVSKHESALVVIALHLKSIAQRHHDGIEFIEDMLRRQLIAAIGKIVTPVVSESTRTRMRACVCARVCVRELTMKGFRKLHEIPQPKAVQETV